MPQGLKGSGKMADAFGKFIVDTSKAVAKNAGKGRQNGGSNPWITHVKRYRAANPHLTYGEAMQKAKASYK